MRSLAAALAAVAITGAALAADPPDPDRRSGYDFMSPETRAMQDDEAANPGLLWVLQGEALWKARAGAASAACADCHGDARASMKGVAARYPAFDAAQGGPVDLEQRISTCRVERQRAPALAYESPDLLALTAYIARQSRGLPIDVGADPRLAAFVAAGRALFQRRQGQLDLACTQCHDQYAGRRLAGNAVPQGHPTGYPVYRLEWQSLGSLQRRLRNCMVGIRAEPYAFGSRELVDLELFLMWRARGMRIETPGVRP